MKNTLTIYFDEGCGICKKVRSFLSFFDFQKNVIFPSQRI